MWLHLYGFFKYVIISRFWDFALSYAFVCISSTVRYLKYIFSKMKRVLYDQYLRQVMIMNRYFITLNNFSRFKHQIVLLFTVFALGCNTFAINWCFIVKIINIITSLSNNVCWRYLMVIPSYESIFDITATKTHYIDVIVNNKYTVFKKKIQSFSILPLHLNFRGYASNYSHRKIRLAMKKTFKV